MHDTKYLQELVGDALARGTAATVAAQPNDPVEYLGQWLLRYVKNAEIVGQFAAEKQDQLEMRKAELEAAAAAAAKVKEEQEVRRQGIIELSQTLDEPRVLLQKAVDLIVKFTAAGAAYAATVAEPEEPDWVYPEDPEDPAAAESDDEADPPPPAPPPEDGEEPAPEADAPPAEDEGEDIEGAGKKKVQKLLDYSKKYLSYLAATSGQEFMLTTELHRPPPPPEDDPEAKPEPTPFTFRILDERRPMIYAGNAAFEPAMSFFRGFPKIGAYQACGVQSPSTGEFKAVIAADTLFPESGGQTLSQEDQDFIWHVSRALSQAFDNVEKAAAELTEGRSAQDLVDSLKAQVVTIYHPPLPAGAPAEPPVDPAAPEEGGAEESGEVPPPEESGEDPVSIIKVEIKTLEGQIKEAESAREAATGALEKAESVLAAIKDTLMTIGQGCLPVLRNTRVVPQATFHVLKAVLHVLGKEADTFKNWKRVFMYFTAGFFLELQQYNATQDRDLNTWKHARSCYKALGEDGVKKMEAEMPDSQLGVLLLMWLKQVRKVARKAAAFRASRDAEELLHDTLDKKKIDLEAAEKKKAEDEEAARKAAEEAAAAEAAAAAAEGGEEAPAEEE